MLRSFLGPKSTFLTSPSPTCLRFQVTLASAGPTGLTNGRPTSPAGARPARPAGVDGGAGRVLLHSTLAVLDIASVAVVNA
jgi:hypothetical protein